MIQSVTGSNDIGSVTLSQCNDDTGAFVLDTSSTTITPNPIVKGSDLAFGLEGVVTSSIEVENVHVHVDWNGSPLYDEDHPGKTPFDSTFEYKLVWNVPSFAPAGHYDFKLVATDSDGKSNACVAAVFDL